MSNYPNKTHYAVKNISLGNQRELRKTDFAKLEVAARNAAAFLIADINRWERNFKSLLSDGSAKR